jgi:hypothetical protein
VEKTLLRIGLRPPALIRRMIESGPSIPFSVRLEAGFQRLGLPAPAFLKRWVYYVNLSTTERSYLEINRALRRLGVSPRVNDTPAERAATLERLLPQVTTAVRNLLVEYQRGAYSPHHAHPQIARRAGMEIRRCSYRTLFSRWLAHFQRPVRRENYSGISSQ